MRFITFKTPQPKRFNYRPRYYDKAKEERNKRKAEMGYESSLNHRDDLRLRMNSRWKKGDESAGAGRSKVLYYLIYGTVILGGIYLIFFTDFVNNLVRAFGVNA